MNIEDSSSIKPHCMLQSACRFSRIIFALTTVILFSIYSSYNLRSSQISLVRSDEVQPMGRFLAAKDDDEEEEEKHQVKIGVADLLPVGEFAKKIGADFDIAVKFVGVHELDYDYHVKSLLDEGLEVVIVAEFFSNTSDTNLVEIINGEYDKYLLKFIADWRRDGNKEINIRPLHEMNSDWYEWGTYKGGTNTIRNFIKAFRHIHSVFKRGRANFKMQLAYNCENAGGDDTPFSEWFPGEKYVDMILCSTYNRYGLNKWQRKWESFYEIFIDGYERMAAVSDDIPLGVGETSTVSKGGDRIEWFREAFESFEKDFPRLVEVDFFFINKEGDDEADWGLNTKKELRAFGDLINKMKGITNDPTAAPAKSRNNDK